MGTVPHFDPCFWKRFVPRYENMKDIWILWIWWRRKRTSFELWSSEKFQQRKFMQFHNNPSIGGSFCGLILDVFGHMQKHKSTVTKVDDFHIDQVSLNTRWQLEMSGDKDSSSCPISLMPIYSISECSFSKYGCVWKWLVPLNPMVNDHYPY